MYFRVVPARPVILDGVSYVRSVEPLASLLFRRLRTGAPLGGIGRVQPGDASPISPATISVRVLDAASGGKAEAVADFLERSGFLVTSVEPAPPALDSSVLLWGHGAWRQRDVLSSYLPDLPDEYENARTRGTELVVVVAPDFDAPGPG